MTEDYVSFETAILLKEKGFEQNYYYCPVYWKNGKTHELSFEGDDGFPYGDNECVAPSLGVAMKWLRKVHKIDIDIDVYSKHSWCDSTDYCTSIFSHGYRIMIEKNEVFNTYEEAAEAAILYVLKNLI